MYLKRGTVGERDMGMGRKRRGEGQYTSNLGPEWMGIAPQRKGGIPSKYKGFVNRGGIFQAKGDYQGDVHVPLI
jgi:hypothetical protein